ncbi:hypothetical protein [Chlamydia abortus]|uniref:Uncharacterized protein n=1 Tax=Chlamydia abortus (strain DSM 27085 / S26/3) TaxID=218497 RepID=Q5L4X7_CHLAB|nr:hypothetical protein [Chlamydia abortus]ASD30981.1 hypothetical protein CEF07_04620 [Chlamydia abortus]AUS60358.1 uncharacterized protein CHAB577_0937 [Chlamydia abortus]QRR31623.1 hypothetical protein JS522_04565 [Chlamydia abortus]CAH64318.1 conserved hypothetical protein [Chlamydia abortus S26/3]CED80922.1 conserved hypothetical protein [Chlamydia abortus]
MNKKLAALSSLSKIEIYHSLLKVRHFKSEKHYLSQELVNIKERMTLVSKVRKEQFLYRNNIEHYNSLLEHLQTLQVSIYKQHDISCNRLQEHQSKLLELINRRKIIEKIKNNKYSKYQEIGTQG